MKVSYTGLMDEMHPFWQSVFFQSTILSRSRVAWPAAILSFASWIIGSIVVTLIFTLAYYSNVFENDYSQYYGGHIFLAFVVSFWSSVASFTILSSTLIGAFTSLLTYVYFTLQVDSFLFPLPLVYLFSGIIALVCVETILNIFFCCCAARPTCLNNDNDVNRVTVNPVAARYPNRFSNGLYSTYKGKQAELRKMTIAAYRLFFGRIFLLSLCHLSLEQISVVLVEYHLNNFIPNLLQGPIGKHTWIVIAMLAPFIFCTGIHILVNLIICPLEVTTYCGGDLSLYLPSHFLFRVIHVWTLVCLFAWGYYDWLSFGIGFTLLALRILSATIASRSSMYCSVFYTIWKGGPFAYDVSFWANRYESMHIPDSAAALLEARREILSRRQNIAPITNFGVFNNDTINNEAARLVEKHMHELYAMQNNNANNNINNNINNNNNENNHESTVRQLPNQIPESPPSGRGVVLSGMPRHSAPRPMTYPDQNEIQMNATFNECVVVNNNGVYYIQQPSRGTLTPSVPSTHLDRLLATRLEADRETVKHLAKEHHGFIPPCWRIESRMMNVAFCDEALSLDMSMFLILSISAVVLNIVLTSSVDSDTIPSWGGLIPHHISLNWLRPGAPAVFSSNTSVTFHSEDYTTRAIASSLRVVGAFVLYFVLALLTIIWRKNSNFNEDLVNGYYTLLQGNTSQNSQRPQNNFPATRMGFPSTNHFNNTNQTTNIINTNINNNTNIHSGLAQSQPFPLQSQPNHQNQQRQNQKLQSQQTIIQHQQRHEHTQEDIWHDEYSVDDEESVWVNEDRTNVQSRQIMHSAPIHAAPFPVFSLQTLNEWTGQMVDAVLPVVSTTTAQSFATECSQSVDLSTGIESVHQNFNRLPKEKETILHLPKGEASVTHSLSLSRRGVTSSRRGGLASWSSVSITRGDDHEHNSFIDQHKKFQFEDTLFWSQTRGGENDIRQVVNTSHVQKTHIPNFLSALQNANQQHHSSLDLQTKSPDSSPYRGAQLTSRTIQSFVTGTSIPSNIDEGVLPQNAPVTSRTEQAIPLTSRTNQTIGSLGVVGMELETIDDDSQTIHSSSPSNSTHHQSIVNAKDCKSVTSHGTNENDSVYAKDDGKPSVSMDPVCQKEQHFDSTQLEDISVTTKSNKATPLVSVAQNYNTQANIFTFPYHEARPARVSGALTKYDINFSSDGSISSSSHGDDNGSPSSYTGADSISKCTRDSSPFQRRPAEACTSTASTVLLVRPVSTVHIQKRASTLVEADVSSPPIHTNSARLSNESMADLQIDDMMALADNDEQKLMYSKARRFPPRHGLSIAESKALRNEVHESAEQVRARAVDPRQLVPDELEVSRYKNSTWRPDNSCSVFNLGCVLAQACYGVRACGDLRSVTRLTRLQLHLQALSTPSLFIKSFLLSCAAAYRWTALLVVVAVLLTLGSILVRDPAFVSTTKL